MNKIKIMFVCHGNICRSTMAEALFRHMVKEEGLSDRIFIDSAATSYESIGEPVYYATRDKLAEFGISTEGIYSTKLKKSDFEEFDYIFTMDQNNMNYIVDEFGSYYPEKVIKFMDLTDHPRDIADPWYTGNFDDTYDDIHECCNILMEKIKREL